MNSSIDIPNSLLPWLKHTQSLTEKVSHLGHVVRVSIISEQWIGALFRRDVLIYCNEKPCWYGRTIIPFDTYQLRHKVFDGLSNTPIGTVLYYDPAIKLKRRRFFRWDKHCFDAKLRSQCHQKNKQLLWARASTFHVDKSPIFLMEMFLPAMEQKILSYE